ncbi:MAG: hypothetical protein JKY67_12165 [Pseudomonadales bacterium]|nr:hypothetical protein [Pseudomonadales bacterium]
MGKNTPLSLVKYTTADVGISVLKNKKLRWSAPHAFSDPFENSANTPLGFDQNDLTNMAVRSIASMIFARNDPLGEANPIKKAVRRWRAEDRFHSEEEAVEALSELLPTMIAQRFVEVETYFRSWVRYAYNARVLCLCDSFDDMGCWDSYGDQHRGLAIRFKVGEENCVDNPKRISYRTQRSVVTTLREQVGIFVGEQIPNDPDRLEDKLLVKPKQLTSQREWRSIWLPKNLLDPANADMSVSYEDRPFAVGEVSAVYLGVSISELDREEVLAILSKDYPKAKIYQGEVKESEFELDFPKTDGAVVKELTL